MRLNKVDSVFPMYLSEQPGQVYSYTTKELPRNGILSLLEVLKERNLCRLEEDVDSYFVLEGSG